MPAKKSKAAKPAAVSQAQPEAPIRLLFRWAGDNP